jgi:hypothetical protein
MNEAQICPVCNGSGTVLGPLSSNLAPPIVTCHGCQGRGWVGPFPDQRGILEALESLNQKLQRIVDKWVFGKMP